MPPYAPNTLASMLPFSMMLGQTAAPASGGTLADMPSVEPRPLSGPTLADALGRGPLANAGQTGGPTLGDLPGLRVMDVPADIAAVGRLQPRKDGHKGLFPGKDWKTALPLILGAIGDGLRSYGGQQPMFAPLYADMKQKEADREFDRERWAAKLAADREDRLRPKVEQVGNTLGMLDPSTLSYQPFYSAPQPFESYASALGYQPGTKEYRQAVEDYRLGAWSEPAMDAKTTLEGVRYGNRRTLQEDRLATSRRNTDVRVGATRRGQDLAHGDRVRGQDINDRRGRYSSGFGGKDAQPGDGAVIVRKETGERMILKGGKWVPYQ